MRPSEFVRSISEADVALGRLRGFTCTKSGCGGVWVSCDRVSEGKTRELLDKLRELGLPDLLAELGKIVGRQVTLRDICEFWGTNRLYLDCVFPGASEERCREGYRRVLEETRKELEDARELKKRLAGLLVKLDDVGRFVGWFELRHSLAWGTVLELPLSGCGTLELRYSLPSKDFVVIYYPPHGGPPARRVGWFAEYVEGTLRNLGMNRYETTTVFNKVVTRLPDLDPGTGFDLLETFADLAPALSEACVALSVRHLAGKTKERVRV